MNPDDAFIRLLAERVGARGAAGLAVATGAPDRRLAVWLPDSLAEEPAFLIYSVTKTYLAALALRLQEEGRLSLDDPLSRWHPAVPGAERIALRSLLNHSAGIPDYGGDLAYQLAVRSRPERPWRFEDFAAATWEKGLRFEPGSGWAYSNPGYLLVKRILEEAAGASLAELVRGRIAEPLGLRRSFVAERVADLHGLAPATSGLLSEDGALRDVRDCYHPGWVSHGVLVSTASEVVTFLAALFAGRIVSGESLRELTRLVPVPQAPPPWRSPGYGLGVMGTLESPLGPVYGHNGGGPGYGASAFHAPALGPGGVTACALCASEEEHLPEQLVFAALELAARPDAGAS
jgi:D-alanyl-D-alanine carboxypeptidase